MTEVVDQEALNQMIQGKRHLLIKDYYSAVQSFEKVCQLLDDKYGKCSDQCGDAYLNYGIALLELARQETGANEGLVNAKINDPSGSEDEDDEEGGEGEEGDDGDDGDEGDEDGGANEAKTDDEGKKTDAEEDLAVSDQETDKEAEKKSHDQSKDNTESNKSNENGKVHKTDDEVKTNGDSKENNKDVVKSDKGDEPCGSLPDDLNEPSTSTGIKRSDDDEEPTNTEIAWEVLSIAKEIFTRQVDNGEDVKFKLAEALQKLGEIATEWENNEVAIEMLTDCLKLREQTLPDDDRLIAETHYHIGNAHSFIGQIERANEYFQSAIDVIKKRIENLKQASTDEKKTEEELSTINKEIVELEGILPDMVARIEDRADQMMATIRDALRMAATDAEEEERAAKLKSKEPKPITNITHLVKRKHNDNTESNGTSSGSKKLCTNDHQSKEVEKSDAA